MPNWLLYRGQQYDGETEQYYLRSRYYNPEIGRFMQEDVHRGDGLNLYAYCANNPVRYYDPSGYSKTPEVYNTWCPGATTNGDAGNEESGINSNVITNKFPNEQMLIDGKFLEYIVENGHIKGINGLNQVDFVITQNSELLIGNKHYFLGQGQDVLAAEQLKINGQGQIKRIDNLSGHYRPTVSEAMNYPKLFGSMGFDLNKTWVEFYDIEIDSSGFVQQVTNSYKKMLGEVK